MKPKAMPDKLTPQQIRDALTEEERFLYDICSLLANDHGNVMMNHLRDCPKLVVALESLAAERIEKKELRKMLEKHHWVDDYRFESKSCPECGWDINDGDAPDCALAALLAKHKEK